MRYLPQKHTNVQELEDKKKVLPEKVSAPWNSGQEITLIEIAT